MRPRQQDLIGRVFTGADGKPYEGQRFIQIHNDNTPTGFLTTEIHYLKGKIHGDPAIIYPDGREERWENGQFIEVTELPYTQR